MNTSMLNLASILAEESNHSQWHLGSVITRGGSVLSRGVSKPRNPVEIVDGMHSGCSVHAEKDALAQCANPKGATIFVARLTPGHRTLAMARPCNACMASIIEAKVKRVVYSMNEEEYGTINISKMTLGSPGYEKVFKFPKRT